MEILLENIDKFNATEEEMVTVDFNDTATASEEELNCMALYHMEMIEAKTTPPLMCPRTWDTLLCWPPTAPGTKAYLPCFDEFNGIRYDTTKNATRWCHKNATWDNYTDYTACSDLPNLSETTGIEPTIEVATMLYFIGYTVSLIAVSLAVWIFIYFKDLRCLRNTIHTNLMCTYMVADFMWILTSTLQMSVQSDMTSCLFLIILLHYFHLTNFFWMFVEGLYLYMLVVKTFTRENLKLHAYVIIGWGIPLVVVIIWGAAKSFANVGSSDSQAQADSVLLRHCPWMTPHVYDWIYQAPACAVLALNFLFLVKIMWVLITKLRSANNVETQQYRKATKALVVLIPLLGITYIVILMGPTEGIPANIYAYIRAGLISTQGFTVALFYCFLNTEVQNTMRHHITQWKEARDIGSGHRYSTSKEWSSNSKNESMKLFKSTSQTSRFFKRKRQLSVSEATTMTLVGHSIASTGSGGGGGGGGGFTICSKIPNGTNSDVSARVPLNPLENPV